MVAVVEAFHVSAAIATFIGASLGAITNFTVSRVWAFRTRHLPLMGQAVRYAMVSFGSVMINSLGEWLVNGRMHVEYIVARLLVSVAVSLLWNFPMHRGFVFRDRSSTLT
jgi:putative flippase GtrA